MANHVVEYLSLDDVNTSLFEFLPHLSRCMLNLNNKSTPDHTCSEIRVRDPLAPVRDGGDHLSYTDPLLLRVRVGGRKNTLCIRL